jgi:RNA polymerase sigma-70 factor (ECF subfamily)
VNPVDLHEKKLIEQVRNNDRLAFSILFTRYYSDLVRFSSSIIHDTTAAEEIVQDLFVRIWENRRQLNTDSLKSYLLKSVQNRSIDYLRHLTIKNNFARTLLEHPVLLQNDTENYILYTELESEVNQALNRIPESYAEVFKKSRFEALNHQEIAKLMGISVRTVEERIRKALQLLRIQLRDFTTLF